MAIRQTGIAEPSDVSEVKRETLWVLLIGIASGALYLLVYLMQHAIFLNGFFQNIAGVMVRGVPVSRTSWLLESIGYYGSTVALFVLYLWLLLLCRRGRLRHRRARKLALLFPVLFNLGLLFGRPYLSSDLFTYIAQGYVSITPGSNPYVNSAAEVVKTPLGRQLLTWGWGVYDGVSLYGALWTQVESAVVRLTQQLPLTEQVPTAMLLLKSLVVSASLLCAALIWYILGRVSPRNQLLGTLVYLWNPVVIVEFAAEGHNDALMIFFMLLSLLLAVQARPAASLVALILGVLAKQLPLILLPAQVVYFWHTRRNWFQFVRQLVLGLVVGLVLAALLYRPFWVGLETFKGLYGADNLAVASTKIVAFTCLKHLGFKLPVRLKLASLILSGIFSIYLLAATLRVHDKQRLLKACGDIMLVYLLVLAPLYWPWYACFPLALMALSLHDTRRWIMIFVLTFCSRLIAPINDMQLNTLISWSVESWVMTLLGLTLPLFIFLLLPTWRLYGKNFLSK